MKQSPAETARQRSSPSSESCPPNKQCRSAAVPRMASSSPRISPSQRPGRRSALTLVVMINCPLFEPALTGRPSLVSEADIHVEIVARQSAGERLDRDVGVHVSRAAAVIAGGIEQNVTVFTIIETPAQDSKRADISGHL